MKRNLRGSKIDKSTTCENKKSKKCTQSASTIYAVPNEVLIIIMKNLSIYERMSFGMACKRIHNVFNSTPKLHKDKVAEICGDKNYDIFFNLFTSKRNEQNISHTILTNIRFISCKRITFNEHFWQLYGKYVQSLNFEVCDFCDYEILRCINYHCPSLEELILYHITDCTTIALNKCSTLRYEKLKKIQSMSLSDYSLNNFIANAPNLKCIASSNLEFLVKEYEQMLRSERIEDDANEKSPEELNAEDTTYNNLLEVLPRSNITSICERDFYTFMSRDIYAFTDRDYTCDELIDISNFKQYGFQLEEICIEYSSERENDSNGFKTLINMYGDNLKYIHFTKVADEREMPIMPDVRKLINLKTLILSEDVKIEDDFMGIASLKNLETLHIGVDRFDNRHDVYGVKLYNVLKELKNLRRLFIKGAYLNKFDVYLKGKSIGLIELHLQDWIKMNTKETLVALYENHKTLRKLTLISKKSFIIDEYFCSGENNKSNKNTVPKYHNGLSSLKNLEYLMIKNTLINGRCIMEEFKWNELKTLNLPENKNITDAAILSLSKNCPALIELSLRDCKSITDKGVKYLCNLRRLRKIDLNGTKVTSVGVNYLINSSLPLVLCYIGNKNKQQKLMEKLQKKLNYKDSVDTMRAERIHV